MKVSFMPFFMKKDTIQKKTNAEKAGEIGSEKEGHLMDVKPPYIYIKGLDKPVSKIFYGTASMPFIIGKDASDLFDAAFSLGINAFDCARGYGLAEKSLGIWVKKRNNRDQVVILTKGGNVDKKGRVCVNRKTVENELSQSLKMLQMDYIDIYLLHRDDPNTPVSELIDVLNEAKRAGKVRIFGVSNWKDERIAEANTYAKSHGLEGFSVSSPNYGLTITKEDPWGGDCVSISGPENRKAREWYVANQMPVIAYSSLGRGFFSGRFKSGDYEGAKKILDKPAQKGYLCEENMRRLKRAEEMAEKYGVTVSEIAMRYVFASPMNVCAVVSTSNPTRMAQNVSAANHPLADEDVLYLESDGHDHSPVLSC